MGSQHKHAIHSMQLSSILHAAEVRTEQPFDSQECPLCKIKPGRSRRNFVTHVGRHMESIALAVLPHNPGDDSDDESVTSTSVTVKLVEGGEWYLYVPLSCRQDSSRPEFAYESEMLNAKLFHKNRRLGTAYTLLFGPGDALLLAQYYVDKNRDRFPGGIFWIDGGSGETLNHEWERMARQLMKLPAMTATSNLQMKELRFWFESRHDWVIIFNGMKGFNEVDQHSLRSFLPKSPESSLIFVMGENDDLSPDTKRTLQRHGIYDPPWGEYAGRSGEGLCHRCGMSFKDIDRLKEHMLVCHKERPEKCPVVRCEYYRKGFARKCDKDRHVLTHFNKTIICNFCTLHLDGSVPAFNRVDLFKRHLSAIHGVGKGRVSSELESESEISSEVAQCSICAVPFVGPQALYDHLQECIHDVLSKNSNHNPQITNKQALSSDLSLSANSSSSSFENNVSAPPLKENEKPSSLYIAPETVSHIGPMETSNTLLVDNIPQDANKQILQQLFGHYGEIESIHLPRNGSTGLHRGFAYICFSHRESAVTTFELLNGEPMYGQALMFRYAPRDLSLESPELGDRLTNEKEVRSESHELLPQSNEPPTVKNLEDQYIQESHEILEPIDKETLNPYNSTGTMEEV